MHRSLYDYRQLVSIVCILLSAVFGFVNVVTSRTGKVVPRVYTYATLMYHIKTVV